MNLMIPLYLLSAAIFTAFTADELVRVPDHTTPIETHSLKTRKTERLKLKNGMELYLISDPNTVKSGVAVAVETGSWQDPKQYQGMAHFLEHMLFQGTAKYPDPGEYTKFLSNHDGKRNAYTASDRTVYMNEFNNEVFKDGLDRLAHFFIDPLFEQKQIEKEVNAVDNEFKKNIKHDGWRAQLIECETGNPNHPRAMFSIGNLDTLKKIPHEAMKEWYIKHYSSDNMHAVLLSTLPMDQLENLAVKTFSQVPKRAVEPFDFSIPLVLPSQLGRKVVIQPINKVRALSIGWLDLPKNLMSGDGQIAMTLVTNVLNNESPNSLAVLLKKNGLAENLSAAYQNLSKENPTIEINITLTKEGLERVDEVIRTCFQAIALLRTNGIPLHFFEENKQLMLNKWKYQQRMNAFSEVSYLASEMIDQRPFDHFPEVGKTATHFPEKEIQEVILALSPTTATYTIIDCDKDPSFFNFTEPYMQAKYAIIPIPPESLNQWASEEPGPLGYPDANPYVTELKVSKTKPTTPSLLIQEPLGKLYFSGDDYYKEPRSFIQFNIHSPLFDGSPKQVALGDIYTYMISQKTIPQIDLAGRAGVSCYLNASILNFDLGVSGFSEGTHLLAETLFEEIAHYQPSEEAFNQAYTKIKDDYANAANSLPIAQAQNVHNSMLMIPVPQQKDLANAIETITFKDIEQFTTDLFSKMYVKGFFYGNLCEKTAREIWEKFKAKFPSAAPFETKDHPVFRSFHFNQNGPSALFSFTTPPEYTVGSGARMTVELGTFSYDLVAILNIFNEPFSDQVFNTLRTKQQIGYWVVGASTEIQHTFYLLLSTLSGTYNAKDSLARINLFLSSYNLEKEIPETRFNTLKEAALQKLYKLPENMGGRFNEYFNNAFYRNGNFNYRDQMIVATSKLTYKTFIDTLKPLLADTNRKRISITAQGSLDPKTRLSPEEVTEAVLLEHSCYSSTNPN